MSYGVGHETTGVDSLDTVMLKAVAAECLPATAGLPFGICPCRRGLDVVQSAVCADPCTHSYRYPGS